MIQCFHDPEEKNPFTHNPAISKPFYCLLLHFVGTPYELLLIAQWLACLYRCLDEFHDNTVLYSTLKSLKLVPLSDGRLVSLQENTVFTPFPIKSESNKHKMGKNLRQNS